jgi:ABC-type branched-subunit amino acid transport system ATPase component
MSLPPTNSKEASMRHPRSSKVVSPASSANGAGKTTIFSVITGFLRPDTGSVRFQGQTLDGWKPQAIVAAGIARTFRNLRLFTGLTAIESVPASLLHQTGEDPIAATFHPFHVAAAQRRRRDEARAILNRAGLSARQTTRLLCRTLLVARAILGCLRSKATCHPISPFSDRHWLRLVGPIVLPDEPRDAP